MCNKSTNSTISSLADLLSCKTPFMVQWTNVYVYLHKGCLCATGMTRNYPEILLQFKRKRFFYPSKTKNQQLLHLSPQHLPDSNKIAALPHNTFLLKANKEISDLRNQQQFTVTRSGSNSYLIHPILFYWLTEQQLFAENHVRRGSWREISMNGDHQTPLMNSEKCLTSSFFSHLCSLQLLGDFSEKT